MPESKTIEKIVEIRDNVIYESDADLLRRISEFDKFVREMEPDMYVVEDTRHYEYAVDTYTNNHQCTIFAKVVYKSNCERRHTQ